MKNFTQSPSPVLIGYTTIYPHVEQLCGSCPGIAMRLQADHPFIYVETTKENMDKIRALNSNVVGLTGTATWSYNDYRLLGFEIDQVLTYQTKLDKGLESLRRIFAPYRRKLAALVSSVAFLVAMFGCQSESLDIQAPYRIRLQASPPGANLQAHQTYSLPLELLTDSYYSKYGYQLLYYQQTGLGRLEWVSENETKDVLQKVPTSLPLGASSWRFTPEAAGNCQVVLIAKQERGYTQSDTLRLNFQVAP